MSGTILHYYLVKNYKYKLLSLKLTASSRYTIQILKKFFKLITIKIIKFHY